MKHIICCFLITAMVQFSACYPADDTVSNMMSNMSAFSNKSQSSMESMTSSKNTTQTFTTSKSNLLLEAAKTLDITNLKSDEEFLRLLFESAFNIIIDIKSEESLFFSDLTIIVPSIIEKIVKQLQVAFFNVFFGGFVNAGAIAADMGLKIATALETGKLSLASQGIETAENIADTIASNVPSNGITDEVKKIVNASLDSADGAIKEAKKLETEGSNAISNVLNRFKTANASSNFVDISSKIANTLEKIADKIAGSPANGAADEVKKIVSSSVEGANDAVKAAKALDTAKLTAASKGVETAQKIADKIAGILPSNGITDQAKKIVSTSVEGANDAIKAAKALETAKLTAASKGVETVQKIADKIADSLPSNGVTDQVKKIVSIPVQGANAAVKTAKALETAKLTAASQGVQSAQISPSVADSNGDTNPIKALETVVSKAIGGVLNTFKLGK